MKNDIEDFEIHIKDEETDMDDMEQCDSAMYLNENDYENDNNRNVYNKKHLSINFEHNKDIVKLKRKRNMNFSLQECELLINIIKKSKIIDRYNSLNENFSFYERKEEWRRVETIFNKFTKSVTRTSASLKEKYKIIKRNIIIKLKNNMEKDKTGKILLNSNEFKNFERNLLPILLPKLGLANDEQPSRSSSADIKEYTTGDSEEGEFLNLSFSSNNTKISDTICSNVKVSDTICSNMKISEAVPMKPQETDNFLQSKPVIPTVNESNYNVSKPIDDKSFHTPDQLFYIQSVTTEVDSKIKDLEENFEDSTSYPDLRVSTLQERIEKRNKHRHLRRILNQSLITKKQRVFRRPVRMVVNPLKDKPVVESNKRESELLRLQIEKIRNEQIQQQEIHKARLERIRNNERRCEEKHRNQERRNEEKFRNDERRSEEKFRNEERRKDEIFQNEQRRAEEKHQMEMSTFRIDKYEKS